jgi:adenylyltransferase/sulfurtransferase
VHVAIVGCGVRGAVAAALLAGAGVRELSLVDGATVEQEDLGTHPLQFTPDLNAPKAEALAAKLGLIDPAVHAQPFPAFLDAGNAAAILTGVDVALDCAGDEQASAAVRTAAEELGVPVVAAPQGWDPAARTTAQVAAVGALQADAALAFSGADARFVLVRIDPSTIA